MKNKIPRKTRSNGSKLPCYGSMAQCEAATGIPVALQKLAKVEGCEAFRAHRVSLEMLLKFLGPRIQLVNLTAVTESSARKELDHVRAKRENLKYRREAGELVSLSDVKQGAEAAMSELFGTLDRIFCSELPPDLVGSNEIQMRDKFRKELDAVKVEVKAKLYALAEAQPKEGTEE